MRKLINRAPFLFWHTVIWSGLYLSYRYYGNEEKYLLCNILVLWGIFRLFMFESSRN